MVNVKKLKGKMVEKGYNVERMAEVIGKDSSTLYRRINSAGECFTLREATDIAKTLQLTYAEVNEIFFADFVA